MLSVELLAQDLAAGLRGDLPPAFDDERHALLMRAMDDVTGSAEALARLGAAAARLLCDRYTAQMRTERFMLQTLRPLVSDEPETPQ